MRRLLTTIALATALGAGVTPLAGCAGDTVRLTAAKALLVTEAGADGANHAATIAAPSLTPSQAASLKVKVDGLNTIVSAAHDAYKAGSATATQALTAALNAIADVQKDAHP